MKFKAAFKLKAGLEVTTSSKSFKELYPLIKHQLTTILPHQLERIQREINHGYSKNLRNDEFIRCLSCVLPIKTTHLHILMT